MSDHEPVERLSNILHNKLLYEMAMKEIIEEVVEITKNINRRRETVLAYLRYNESDSEDSSDDEDDFLFFLKRRVQVLNNEDEISLMASLEDISNRILSSPLHILRPYHQGYVTSNGANRVTIENFREKFRGLFKEYFRFEEEHILHLLEVLKLPESVEFQGYRSTGLECLLLSLYRLASHTRYVEIVLTFDMLPQMMSSLFNGTMIFLYQRWGSLVRSMNQPWLTSRVMLELYAEATQRLGLPLENCVGFLDGTVIPVAKPVRGQRSWYNGHHKTHCFKSLGLVVPSGLIAAYGPFDGSTHDSTAAESISLDIELNRRLTFEDVAFTVYADPGFAVGSSVITPFSTRTYTEEERNWNRAMSRGRISVEWSFGRVKTLWKRLTYKDNLKTLMSPTAIYWFTAIHLTNLHSCFYGSQVNRYFGMEKPTLESYLS